MTCVEKVILEVERETVEAVPVPLKLTVCGLLLALSAILTEAVRAPDAAGVKTTVNVQFALAATLVVQVFVADGVEKSPEFVPVTVMPVRVRAAVPVLLRVTV
jgi:hypothetical protein